jgi:hypothetical protein
MAKITTGAKTVTAVSPVAPVNNPTTLTVVVLNSKNQPVEGASVSITPSDASAVTNSAGEAQFQLGSALRYSVTASADNKTVTVPYYVTPNGATRLVVNPTYVQTVEARLHPPFWATPQFIWSASIVLVIIIAIVAWRFFRRPQG